MEQDTFAEAARLADFYEWFEEEQIETANLQLTALDNEAKGFTWEVFQ